jgi:hypothetical protein
LPWELPDPDALTIGFAPLTGYKRRPTYDLERIKRII